MMSVMRLLALLLSLASVAAVSGAHAEDALSTGPDGHALLDAAFQNLYADDYVQTVWLTTRARGGRDMSRRLQITRKQSEFPGKALVRFLQPQDVRRTSILVLENRGASDDHYVYLPATRRTKHLSGAQRADSFFGTDLSFEDLEPKRADDWEARAVGTERFAELDCVVVEARPRTHFESIYERLRTCIEPRRAIMLWTEFHRKRRPDDVWKRLEIDPAQVRPVGERQIPFLMTMTTLRRGTETRVVTERYELRAEIPDRLFSVVNLEVGDADRDRIRSTRDARGVVK